MKTIFATGITLLLVGCASAPAPTPQEIADPARYGEPPVNYQKTITAYMPKVVIDPDSAQYSNWRGPVKAYAYDRYRDEYKFGHKVCVDVNAKTKKGGYGGWRPYLFILNGDTVIYHERGKTPGERGVNDFRECDF